LINSAISDCRLHTSQLALPNQAL